MPDLLEFVLEGDGEEDGGTVEVDISQFFKTETGEPEPPKTTMIVFAEPSTAQVFQSSEDAVKLKRKFPDFPSALGATCAIMAMSHVSPQIAIPKGYFYAHMAAKRKAMFMYIVAQFTKAFPHLSNLETAIADEKNDLSTVPEE